jgi:microcystin-dependent protein
MGSTTDLSNNDIQASQIYGTGGLGIPAGTNAQRPSIPTSGMVRFNIVSKKLEYYGPSSWLTVSSDDDIAAKYVLQAAPSISGNLEANGNRLTELADPTESQDAVTLSYLNDRLGGTSTVDADTLDGLDSTDFATATQINDLQTQIDSLLGTTNLDKVVKVDVVQSFTSTERSRGRTNLGLGQYPEDPTDLPINDDTQTLFDNLETTLSSSFLPLSGGTMTGAINMDNHNLTNIANFVGMVAFFAMEDAPTGWLVCRGQAVSRTTYANLFDKIGTLHGSGNGSTTFNLPDLRGYFIRGWNPNDGSGTSDAPYVNHVGDIQSSAFESHDHAASMTSSGAHQHTGKTDANDALSRHSHRFHGRDSDEGHQGGFMLNSQFGPDYEHYADTDSDDETSEHRHNFTTNNGGNHTHDITIGNRGGTETRPMNVSMLGCIKF